MRFKRMALMALALGALSIPAGSETLAFKELWERVESSSPDLVASQKGFQAAQSSANQASRNAWPKLSLEAGGYHTDDAGQVFFSNLGQRSVTPLDFSPDTLNRPGFSRYGQGSLTLEVPIYTGGVASAQSKAARHQASAAGWNDRINRDLVYSKTAGAYAHLLVLEDERIHLEALSDDVNAILGRYRIGDKSNPVGYSGLLGLKNLKNRLKGLITANGSETRSLRRMLSSLAGDLPEDWTPRADSCEGFLQESLPVQESDLKGASASVRSTRESSLAAQKAVGAARGAYLPSLGLFASQNLAVGERDTASSTAVGARLKWDLFQFSRGKGVEAARLKAEAALAATEAESRRSQAQRESAMDALNALREQTELLNQSDGWLVEQTRTADGLFRQGALSALQLVEVLARRADLLRERSAVEKARIEYQASAWMQRGVSEAKDAE